MDELAEIPKIIELAPGLGVRQEIDNLAWIDMGQYVIVVDALEHAEKEVEVFGAIRDVVGDKPVRYLLNTHTHYDHVALNGAFVRRWGTQIVSVETTEIPATGLWFEGTRRVGMLPMPGCHTDEDCVVWAPDDRVLFPGDIFGWGLIPLTIGLRDETAGLLFDTYARMIALAPAVVVPGHGPLCTVAELERWVKYFRWLIDEARAGVEAGASEAEIRSVLAPPADMTGWWRFLKWKHADSVTKILSAVRRGRLTI
ncbi:MAG: MBL fold metallo-hydrolase [Planctomycetota bacterium]